MNLAMANGFGGVGFTEMNEQEVLQVGGGSDFGFVVGLIVGWNEGYAEGLHEGGKEGAKLGAVAGTLMGGPLGGGIGTLGGYALFGVPTGISRGMKNALDTAEEYSQRF